MLTLADQIQKWLLGLGGGAIAVAYLKYLTDKEKNRLDRATSTDTAGTNNFDKVANHLLAIVTRQDAEITALKTEFKADLVAAEKKADEEREDLEKRLTAQATAEKAAMEARMKIMEEENAMIKLENSTLRRQNQALTKDNQDLNNKIRALARQVAGQKNPREPDPPIPPSDISESPESIETDY